MLRRPRCRPPPRRVASVPARAWVPPDRRAAAASARGEPLSPRRPGSSPRSTVCSRPGHGTPRGTSASRTPRRALACPRRASTVRSRSAPWRGHDGAALRASKQEATGLRARARGAAYCAARGEVRRSPHDAGRAPLLNAPVRLPGHAGSPVGVPESAALEIRVRGCVQGVGFRPAVHRLALELALVGEIQNDTEGVLIRVAGPRAALQSFLDSNRTRAASDGLYRGRRSALSPRWPLARFPAS